VIALGFVLILVGFAVVTPKGSGSGSTTNRRSVELGGWRIATKPGRSDDGTQSRRSQVIQALIGLAMIVGGFVVISMS